MSKFVSICVTTCNEAGCKEVTIEYSPSLWRWLIRQPKKVTFEQIGDVWWDKATSARATAQDVRDINLAMLEIKSSNFEKSMTALQDISRKW